MNCRTHEHRHFERTLRSSDTVPGPLPSEGRVLFQNDCRRGSSSFRTNCARLNWRFAGEINGVFRKRATRERAARLAGFSSGAVKAAALRRGRSESVRNRALLLNCPVVRATRRERGGPITLRRVPEKGSGVERLVSDFAVRSAAAAPRTLEV